MWGNERDVEIPFLLGNVRGRYILDVGADRDDYYTYALRSRGMNVVTCDPWPGARADYPVPFADMPTERKYDTVVILSSLEHFAPTEENLIGAIDDADAINKALSIIEEDGVVIVTVPFGKEKIYYDGDRADFIQWGIDRLMYIQDVCDVTVVDEEIYLWTAGGWIKLAPDMWTQLDDVEYQSNGAKNATAVYCGVWK